MPSSEKKVYLTFDDGPVPGPTEFVLETLLKFNATATFFCIGDNVRKHPQVFQKVLAGGHSIGNHTFNHVKGWATPLATYVQNTQLCADEIGRHLTSQTNNHQRVLTNPLFRPPYGRVTRRQVNALKGKYRIIMWDVLSQDYDARLSPERCLEGTINATRAGSVVVFHDSLKAEKNLTYVLPRYLDYLVNEGYTLAAL